VERLRKIEMVWNSYPLIQEWQRGGAVAAADLVVGELGESRWMAVVYDGEHTLLHDHGMFVAPYAL